MKHKKRLLLITLPLIIFFSCNEIKRKEQYFAYTPLEDYKYTEALIQPETELELLAFSGGIESDEKNLYYYQFIVYDKNKGDTLRILAPLISIYGVTAQDTKTYTSPLQYDYKKGITKATYEPLDDSHNLALQTEKVADLAEGKTDVDFEALMQKVDKKRFVITNKDMPELDNPKSPTAIGVLNFKGKPW